MTHARQAAESWPNLTEQSRETLYELCTRLGISHDGKWLSEMAIEAIELLTRERDEARSGLRQVIDNEYHVVPEEMVERWPWLKETT